MLLVLATGVALTSPNPFRLSSAPPTSSSFYPLRRSTRFASTAFKSNGGDHDNIRGLLSISQGRRSSESSSTNQATMPAPELPGFYYDEAKRKYFKIQANHLAPDSSKYSQRSVQREAEEKRVSITSTFLQPQCWVHLSASNTLQSKTTSTLRENCEPSY